MDELIARLEGALTKVQERERPLPWVVHSGSSYRRIASAPASSNGYRSYPDGNVLRAIRQSDGHPDLSMGEDQLTALVDIINELPDVLAALKARAQQEMKS